jgi:tetratricopeptide (TPR) repeat protein
LSTAAQRASAEPELPVDTYAYQRARREELCAELSAHAYCDERLTKDGFKRFADPLPTSGRKAILSAFGYVEAGIGYLSFRGTVPGILRNWLSDLYFLPTGRPRRHRGFDSCWQALRRQIRDWLATQTPRELILTGHSLGGAMAQLAAVELAAEWPIRAVVCFGAPLVGWRAFAAAYDETPIHNRPGVTLGALTTTFVFKSDLVRSFVLPVLGFRPHGRQFVMDEHGRTSDAFKPWYADALHRGLVPLVLFQAVCQPLLGDAPAGYVLDNRAAYGRISGLAAPSASPLDLNNDGRVDWLDLAFAARKASPFLLPLVSQWILMAWAAVAGFCALITTLLSVKFFGRDVTYHSVRERYLQAMTERVARWIPLAYEERGNDLVARNDPKAALAYFDAALAAYEDEGRAAGLDDLTLGHYASQPRLSRTAALIDAGDYAPAISGLNTLIDSYFQTRIEIPISASGAFTFTPLVLALRQRAIALQRNRQFREAMADYAALLSAIPKMSFDESSRLRAAAQRNAGVGGNVLGVLNLLGYKEREVEAEYRRLNELRLRPVSEALAKLSAWAHYQRALCALDLRDFPAVIFEAAAAIETNDRIHAPDAWVYNLRGVAHWKLNRHEEALADYSHAIELEPGIAGFWFARAFARFAPPGHKVERVDGQAFVAARLTIEDARLIEADLVKTLSIDPSHASAQQALDGIREAIEGAGPFK